MKQGAEKVSVSLPAQVLRFAEDYRRSHGLSSRSDVFVEAIKALRERELTDAFEELSREYDSAPEPVLDSGVEEGLEPSNEENW